MVERMDSNYQNEFGIWDYVVFAAMLTVSAAIGVYYRLTGGKQKSTNEYLMADRKMGIIPVAFSLMASFMSAVTLLGVASENYIFGTQFVIINIAYIFGTPLVAFGYLPVFFRLQVTSVYQYLNRRFGHATRLTASVCFQLQMVLYMGIVLYAPALALSAVTGLSKWASIVSVGFVCTFYSTIGGMKAVLWTDVFQSLLMFAAIFAVLTKGGLDAGGLTNILSSAYAGGRLQFFKLDVDPTVRHTLWTQAVGGIFTYTSIYGVNQAQIQRLLTIGNLKKSQMALFLSWPILTLLSLTTSMCGLVVYHAYQNCDPLLTKRIATFDKLLPLYVMDYLSVYPGVAGLFVSGIFSATLSTISSAVNSLAAVTLEDYIKPNLKTSWTDKKLSLLTQFLVLAYGATCLGVAFLAESLGGLLQASLTIFGVVGGPLLGLFTLGMTTTRSNQKGAIVGVLSGFIISCWFGFGASVYKPYNPELPRSVEFCGVFNTTREGLGDLAVNLTSHAISETIFYNVTASPEAVLPITVRPYTPTTNEHIFYPYRISYMWLAPLGFLVTMVVGYFISLVTGCHEISDVDLICPPFQKLYSLSANETPVKFKDVDCTEMLVTVDKGSTECITKL